ncbi:MAG: rRNA maturation RNase YbeY [Pseudomonadota bacterium]
MKTNLDISFHVQNPLWKTRLRPYTKTVRMVLEEAFSEVKNMDTSLRWYDKKAVFEIAIVLADDAFVKELNSQYRGKNKPTNVLSFPASSLATDNRQLTTDSILKANWYELGDIVLALETIEKEAKEQEKTFRNHASHLLIHGFLHLIGYDHIHGKQAEIMEKLEIKILKKLGISNPYL